MMSILEACHSSPVKGHHSAAQTAHKILQCEYYWPTIHRDAHGLVTNANDKKRIAKIRASNDYDSTA